MARRVVDSVRLAPVAGSIAEARRSVDAYAQMLTDGTGEDARLMISELVTNSIRHGRLHPGETIEVTAEMDTDVLRISVRDPGGGFDAPRRSHEQGSEGGWGLFLVGRLAERWGVSRAGGRTTVWFEVPLVPDPSPGPIV